MAYRYFYIIVGLFLFGATAHADADDITPTDDSTSDTMSGVESSATSRDHLVVLTWKLKKGRLDYDRIASVLGEADLAVVQNVEIGEHGDTPILVIADLLEKQRGEHICKAWFRDAKNVRGSVALVWRERTLSLIDGEGKLHATCGTHPWVLPARDQAVPVANFFYRSSMQIVSVRSLDFAHGPKHTAKQIPELFRVDRDATWPTLYAGDTKINAKNNEFNQVRDWHFKTVIKTSPGKMTNNIWFKNIALFESGVMKLSKKFPDVSAAYISDNLSDNPPVRAEFTFNESELNATQTQMLTKKKTGKGAGTNKKTAATRVKVEAYPAPVAETQMSDLNDDLESEASDARDPDSATKAKRKRKHAH